MLLGGPGFFFYIMPNSLNNNQPAQDERAKQLQLYRKENELQQETISALQETVKLLNALRKGGQQYHAVKSSSFITHLN